MATFGQTFSYDVDDVFKCKWKMILKYFFSVCVCLILSQSHLQTLFSFNTSFSDLLS